MLITFERKVPQSSYTSQNDHKSKGYPSKTSTAALTLQKSEPWASAFEIDFQKSYFSALNRTDITQAHHRNSYKLNSIQP